MTSPTAKVFDNQSTSSSVVNWNGGLLAACVVAFLAISGLGLLGAVFVAPFMIFGLTMAAVSAMAIVFPVAVGVYYLLLLLLLPFFWRKLD